MTVVIIVIVGAVVLGILGNLFVHERILAITNRQGLDPYFVYPQTNNVFGPASTLLALFIAFILFSASGGYDDAKKASQTEAASVQFFFRTAAYLPDPSRRKMQQSAICYARAIAGPEWDLMNKGRNELAPVADSWIGTGTNGIRNTLRALGPADALFETLLSADQARGDARRARLTDADPSIPSILSLFMLLAVSLTIIFFALVSPRESLAHTVATVFAAITLVGALALIHNLDRPFRGPLAIEPIQMQVTLDGIQREFALRYGENQVGCDARGTPTRNPA